MSDPIQSSSLLPPNATRLERNVAQLGLVITELPVVLVDLHRVNTCPVPYLPWLAWAKRVEFWNADWSVAQKHQVIADAPRFNQQRGTRSSINRLLSQMLPNISYQLVAWHQLNPKGVPFTFVVNVDTNQAISIEQSQQIHTAVDATKSARDLYGVQARVQQQSIFFTAGVAKEGQRVRITTGD